MAGHDGSMRLTTASILTRTVWEVKENQEEVSKMEDKDEKLRNGGR